MINISGLCNNWKYRLCKFLAGGNKRKYRQVLDGTKTIPVKSTYLQDKASQTTTDNQRELIKIYYLNLMAYEDLILRITGSTKAG